jgi:hypothetical protein
MKRGERPQSQLEALLAASALGRGEVEVVGKWGATSVDVLVQEP